MKASEGDEPVEVEFIETVDVPSADIHVEVTAPGYVTMNVEVEGSGIEFAVLFAGDKARALGDLLYRKGCEAG